MQPWYPVERVSKTTRLGMLLFIVSLILHASWSLHSSLTDDYQERPGARYLSQDVILTGRDPC